MSDAKTKDVTFQAGDSVLAVDTSYSNSFDLRKYREMIILADVDAVTTTFDITLQVSLAESYWVDHDGFSQMSGASDNEKRFTNFGNFVRLKMVVVGGTTIGSNGIIGIAKT